MYSRSLLKSISHVPARRIVRTPFTKRSKPLLQSASLPQYRTYASRSADEAIEEIQEQYGTAKDEFEIASEETEKMTVYAEDDRRAAREELDKLHELFKAASTDPDIGEEVRGRVGQRIRELDAAVKNMEEQAMNQD